LKITKDSGDDTVTGILIKYGGEQLYGILCTLIKEIWKGKRSLMTGVQ
jgi:hypothetical protein